MHRPVLLKEVIEYLNPKPGDKFIDATVDGGGHAKAVLERIIPDGKLLGIDWDDELIEHLKIKYQSTQPIECSAEHLRGKCFGQKSNIKNNVTLVNDSYVNLRRTAEENNFMDADGILFDLGMSSWHLEEAGRGFTFQKDEPLDMRYGKELTDNTKQLTALEVINRWSYDELVRILKEYGEESFAKSIAAGITKQRKDKPIKTTFELVEVIKSSVPFWYRSNRRRLHFATKTFQALRIAVNNELENLKSGLEQALDVLREGGRIAVISFHSLEDRIVKNFLRDKSKAGKLKIIAKKPVIAGLEEITENPRARSAKLRAAVKVKIQI